MCYSVSGIVHIKEPLLLLSAAFILESLHARHHITVNKMPPSPSCPITLLPPTPSCLHHPPASITLLPPSPSPITLASITFLSPSSSCLHHPPASITLPPPSPSPITLASITFLSPSPSCLHHPPPSPLPPPSSPYTFRSVVLYIECVVKKLPLPGTLLHCGCRVTGL